MAGNLMPQMASETVRTKGTAAGARQQLILDIGSATVKWLWYQQAKRQVLAYDIINISQDFQDEAEREAYIKEHLALSFKNKNLAASQVIISYGSPTLQFKRLSLPLMPEGEAAEALRWQLKDSPGFDPEGNVVVHDIIETVEQPDGSKTLEIIVLAEDRQRLVKLARLVQSLGLELADIQSASAGVVNVLPTEARELGCVVEFGSFQTLFRLYQNKKLSFVRRVSVGSHDIINALMSPLVSEKGRVQLSRDEALAVFREAGFTDDPNLVWRDKISGSQIRALMLPFLERLASEITRSLDYLASEYRISDQVQKVYLHGGPANLPGLPKFLGDQCRRQFVLLLPENIPGLPSISWLAAVSNGEKLSLANLAGVALGQNKKLDLLPREIRKEKQRFIQRISIRLVFVAVFAFLLLSWFGIQLGIRDYARRITNAQLEQSNVGDLKNVQGSLTGFSALAAALRQNFRPADAILRELSRITPANIMIEDLSYDQTNLNVVLTCRLVGPDQSIPTDFINALRSSPVFGDTALTQVSSASEAGGAAKFQLKVKVK